VNGRRTFLRGFLSVLLSGGAVGGILKILPSKADARAYGLFFARGAIPA
jgi:hypothetical protein